MLQVPLYHVLYEALRKIGSSKLQFSDLIQKKEETK